MAETDEQDFRLYGPGLPGPDRCTFFDEMWRILTVPSQLLSFHEGDPTSPSIVHIPESCHVTCTVAQRAFKEDRELWNSSIDIHDYEQKRQALYDKRRAERDEWMKKQPSLPMFWALPPEIRQSVWKLASEEHTTRVSINVAKFYEIPIRADCGGGTTPSSHPLEIAATAFLPPLMLVNSEAHSIASKFHRRSFRGLDDCGGVLAKYPTVLSIDGEAFGLFKVYDMELVTEIALTTGYRWDNCRHFDAYFDKLKTVLMAPNLKRFVGNFIIRKSMIVWLCRTIPALWLMKERSPSSERDNPEIVLEVKDFRSGFEFYFQGSPRNIPKFSELCRAGVTH